MNTTEQWEVNQKGKESVLPWQFRFEKLYKKLNGLPDDDRLLSGHCQTYIHAFEIILKEERYYHHNQLLDRVIENLCAEEKRWNGNGEYYSNVAEALTQSKEAVNKLRI